MTERLKQTHQSTPRIGFKKTRKESKRVFLAYEARNRGRTIWGFSANGLRMLGKLVTTMPSNWDHDEEQSSKYTHTHIYNFYICVDRDEGSMKKLYMLGGLSSSLGKTVRTWVFATWPAAKNKN